MSFRLFSYYREPGRGFLRICGIGFAWKDTRRHRLTFSERNGFKKMLLIGAWSVTALL